MNQARVPLSDLPERRQIAPPIIVLVEAWQTVVATLHDVLGDAGKIGTGKSGHE